MPSIIRKDCGYITHGAYGTSRTSRAPGTSETN